MLQKLKYLILLLAISFCNSVSFAQADNYEEIRNKRSDSLKYDFGQKVVIALNNYNRDLEKREIWYKLNSKREKHIIYLVITILILVIIFSGFVFRSLRITRKQKEVIEKQNMIVQQQKGLLEIHQKEIVDSITYASRIQQSLLPTEKYIEKTINRLNRKSSPALYLE